MSSHNLLHGAGISSIYQLQTTLPSTLRGNGDSISILESTFSNITEMNGLKEILNGKTYDPKQCIH